MSSISDNNADSVAPESSISQQAKTSSVITQSLSIQDPVSIGEYFIVKDRVGNEPNEPNIRGSLLVSS
jgi:hypothetical protein